MKFDIELRESVKMTSYFYIVKIGALENKWITKTIFFDTLADSHKKNKKFGKESSHFLQPYGKNWNQMFSPKNENTQH